MSVDSGQSKYGVIDQYFSGSIRYRFDEDSSPAAEETARHTYFTFKGSCGVSVAKTTKIEVLRQPTRPTSLETVSYLLPAAHQILNRVGGRASGL